MVVLFLAVIDWSPTKFGTADAERATDTARTVQKSRPSSLAKSIGTSIEAVTRTASAGAALATNVSVAAFQWPVSIALGETAAPLARFSAAEALARATASSVLTISPLAPY